MKEEIKKYIEEKIRPFLVADGGNIQFVDYEESSGIVKVELQGACAHCAGALMTLQYGVEEALKEKFGDKVKKVMLA
ncbi:MAG: NifU family protein [Myxococcota bacterium]